jgi:hypothetical protein
LGLKILRLHLLTDIRSGGIRTLGYISCRNLEGAASMKILLRAEPAHKYSLPVGLNLAGATPPGVFGCRRLRHADQTTVIATQTAHTASSRLFGCGPGERAEPQCGSVVPGCSYGPVTASNNSRNNQPDDEVPPPRLLLLPAPLKGAVGTAGTSSSGRERKNHPPVSQNPGTAGAALPLVENPGLN